MDKEALLMKARSRDIQASIGKILLQDWDPIGIRNEPAAQDEYDGYVGGVYRLLASGASAQTVAEHLSAIECEQMGYPHAKTKDLRAVAEKLCSLNVRL